MNTTKGNWISSKYSNDDYGVYSESGNGRDIALVRDCECSEANAIAICTAVNETYGKGVNPEAASEMLEALELIIKIFPVYQFKGVNENFDKLLALSAAATAINKAKL